MKYIEKKLMNEKIFKRMRKFDSICSQYETFSFKILFEEIFPTRFQPEIFFFLCPSANQNFCPFSIRQ